MKLIHLKEELEHEVPDGKVLIGHYNSWKEIQYADYKQNLRNAMGPMNDIRQAKHVTINLNNRFSPTALLLGNFFRRKRKARVQIKRVDNLLFVDFNDFLKKFSSVMAPS